MKKYLPFLALLLFIIAELFWGSDLRAYEIMRPIHTFVSPFVIPLITLSILYFVIYLRRDSQGNRTWDSFMEISPPMKWNTALVISLLLLGTVLRFWKLDSLFEGMTYDEAYKGLDAVAIRFFGERPVFLDWNGGREALVAYLVAAAQHVFGFSILSVRFFPALLNCLTLLFLYLLVRRIFNNHLALLSLFLLSVSKYHIIHSRYGVRAGLYTFFEVVVLYLVSPSRDTKKSSATRLILAGALTGLGFYTYIAYRIFPIVLIAFFLQKDVLEYLRRNWKPFLAASAVCILVILPLAKYYADHFSAFTDRMKRTEVFRQKMRYPRGPSETLWISTANTLGIFTIRGDAINRHNVFREPMLSPYSAPFFLFGILITLINIRKPYAFFLMLYFLLSLIPGILSVGAPNAPRVLGALPPAILFCSFGILASIKIIRAISSILARIFLAIILAGNFITGVRDSLFRFPIILDSLSAKISALWGMDRDFANAAALLNQLGNHCEGYASPQFFFHSTVEYLTYSESRHKLFTAKTNLKRTTTKRKVAVVVLQPHVMNPWWLRDDEGKKFYKWWNQSYKLETGKIHTFVNQSYATEGNLGKASDRPLLDFLKELYPKGKVLNFGRFSAFVVVP
jgi:4-amino-4-deoxy-L-arabinose transferase-like glycosyltransferase